MTMIQERIKELGLVLPAVSPPVASYLPSRLAGDLIFISGQLPMKDGKLMCTGPMTPHRNLEEAVAALAQCFLNGLAAASLHADIENIESVIRLGAFVACSPDFIQHHLAANGASDLAVKIFGEKGRHARFAVGVPSLPLDSAVELEIIFQLRRKD